MNMKKKKKDSLKNNSKKLKKEVNRKFSYKYFTVSEIEEELKKEKYKSKYKKILMSTIYTLVIVVSIALIVATLLMPVLQISGTSMKPTFHEGEIVVSLKNANLSNGDIIAFYHGNKILVKRIIATSSEWVNIDKDGNVYVNNILIEEDYVLEKILGDTDVEFPFQVPEETYFVLGDDRSTSVDSRSSEIGTVKTEDIVGKVIFRVWPLKKLGIIN